MCFEGACKVQFLTPTRRYIWANMCNGAKVQEWKQDLYVNSFLCIFEI